MNKIFNANFWYVLATSVGIVVVAVLIILMILQ